MRKWKKAVSLMLTAAMALSFAACGGSASSASSASGTAGSSEAESAADSAAASENVASFTESDVAYVQDKGTLVVGMTDFAPMDYRNDSGEWIGFDADMAKAFAEYLGVEAEFLEINWDNKLMELDTKGVDAIWNGMTITDEVTNGASVSEPYCNNGQVVVVSADKAADYQDVESLSGLSFAVENGSAGAEQLDALGIPYVAHRPADGRRHDRRGHQLPRPDLHRPAEQRGVRRGLPQRVGPSGRVQHLLERSL